MPVAAETPDAPTEPLGRRAASAVVWKGAQAAGSRGLSLVRYLILARLLAPEAFGLLAVAMAGVELLLRLTDFGLVPALIQRKKPTEEHYDSVWTWNVIRAIAVAVVLFVGAPLIAAAFGEPRATALLRVLALRPVFQALVSIKIVDLNRELRFRTLAAIDLPVAVLETALAIALAPTLGVWALIVGALAGDTLAIVLSYIFAPHRLRLVVRRTAVASLLVFGRWLFVATLVGVVGEALLRIVVSRRLGTADLGRYLLAVRITALPFEFAELVLGTVSFPLHSGLQHDDERARRALAVSLAALLMLLGPAYAVLVGVAPSLVSVLGPQWEGTGAVLVLLAFAAVVSIPEAAVVPLLKGRGRGRAVAAVRTFGALSVAAVAWPLTGWFGLAGAGIAVLMTDALTQFVVARVASRALPRPFSRVARPVAAVLPAAAVGGLVAAGVTQLGGFAGLALGVFAGGLVALAGMWLLDMLLHAGLREVAGRVLPPSLAVRVVGRRAATPS